MRIIVNKEILRETAKTEQLVEKVENKKHALNHLEKRVFLLCHV
jgi:hypothetical protein